MSTNTRSNEIPQNQSYFQTQRALLVADIAQSMDSVLTNLNRLNRSLEAVIAVGNEFGSIEALWSTFEGVMGTNPAEGNHNIQGSARDKKAGEDEESEVNVDDEDTTSGGR